MDICKYCFNARVEAELTPDSYEPILTDVNDLSIHVIGDSADGNRIAFVSGAGKPIRLEIETLCSPVAYTPDNCEKRWVTVGRYFPKFCPECGRKLDEYTEKN